MLKPYHPPKLPIKLNYSLITKELSGASFELGKLDGLQRNLPNPTLLISPLTVKEATVSSKIEGTRSTVSDVMMFEAGEKAKYSETQEVVNYKRAMIWAIKALKQRQINLSFIKHLHHILLEGTRGHKTKGKFREEQVFVGKKGVTIEEATYIPPEHLHILEYMENLEKYILQDGEDRLIKAGIIHYQFEAIHPFTDGNGRIGRLLIPLYLYREKILHQPILYLSGYFDRYRDGYIDNLHLVDTKQKYEDWLKYFLLAVKKQAEETQLIIYRINQLIREVEEKADVIKSPYVSKVINFIFTKPIFRSPDLKKELSVGRATALRLLKRFVELNILILIKERRLYIFEDLIKLL